MLRRHIDTGFKLPENLLTGNEDDSMNQLLLSKRIQQQISQASLKFANDATQTKVSVQAKNSFVSQAGDIRTHVFDI